MDFSAILVLPFGAIVAFLTLLGAAIAKVPPPRLLWPWVFSSVVAALMILRWPEQATVGLWLFTWFGMAFSAAVGTVIGGAAARAIIAAIRSRRHR